MALSQEDIDAIVSAVMAALSAGVGAGNVTVDVESIFSGPYEIVFAPSGFDASGYPTWSYGPDGDPQVTATLEYDHDTDEWVLAWTCEGSPPTSGEHRCGQLSGIYEDSPLVLVAPSIVDVLWWAQTVAAMIKARIEKSLPDVVPDDPGGLAVIHQYAVPMGPTHKGILALTDSGDVIASATDVAQAVDVDAVAEAVKSALFDPATVKLKLTAEGYVYAAREDGTPIYYTLSGDTYGDRATIESIYGVENVAKWALLSTADPSSQAGLAEIAARIAFALAWATAEFNNHFRQNTRYQLPITAAGAAVTLTMYGSMLAGWWLHHNRGVVEFDDNGRSIDRYSGQRKQVYEFLAAVQSNKIKLDAPMLTGSYSSAPVASQTPRRHEESGIPGYRLP